MNQQDKRFLWDFWRRLESGNVQVSAALSFIDDREDVPEFVDAWVRGYLRVWQLSEEEISEIPTFIMVRRLTLLGWAVSRAKTGGLTSELGVPFSKGTCKLAESYLEKFQ